MRAIIVDDEILNIRLLESFCKRYAPSIEVIATADHADQATKMIIKHKPDLVFLDIELYNKNAFDVLKDIQQPDLMVVLVTAYEKYAIQAVKVRVMDYLLKPVSIDDFILAVNKCEVELLKIRKLQNPQRNEDEETIAGEAEQPYLVIPYKDHLELVGLDKVLHIEAKGNFTAVTTMDKLELLSSHSLKDFEDRLPAKDFLKVHKFHIVNIKGICKLFKTRAATLTLISGETVPISLSRKKMVFDLLHSE